MGVYDKLLKKHYTPPQRQTQPQELQQSPGKQEVRKMGTQEERKTTSQENGNPGTQEPRNPTSQLPRNPGNKEDGKVASQEPAKTGSQELGKRADFPQQTFNIHPDVIDMLEDMKRDLRRRYSIKTSKEILAEEAIRLLCLEFQQKKNDSQIVHILKKIPGTQENGKPGSK